MQFTLYKDFKRESGGTTPGIFAILRLDIDAKTWKCLILQYQSILQYFLSNFEKQIFERDGGTMPFLRIAYACTLTMIRRDGGWREGGAPVKKIVGLAPLKIICSCIRDTLIEQSHYT